MLGSTPPAMRPRKTWSIAELPVLTVENEVDRALAGIRPENLAVLVGAGVSIAAPSGLPSAAQFLRSFFATCLPPSCETDQWLLPTADLRFESVMSIVQEKPDPELEILDVYSQGRPNLNHRRLAELANRGALILTTNFDGLIEAAARDAPLLVRASSEDYSSIESIGPTPEIWHLHGILKDPVTGVDRRSTIIASIRDCWRTRNLFVRDAAKGRALTTALGDRDLLVLGYSGADDYDIAPALEAIASPRRLLWVQHTDRNDSLLESDGVSPLWIDSLPDGTSWYRAPCANVLATMVGDQKRKLECVTLLAAETETVLAALTNDSKVGEGTRGEPAGAVAQRLVEHFEEWRDKHLHTVFSQYLLALLLARIAGLKLELRRLLVEVGDRMIDPAQRAGVAAEDVQEAVANSLEIALIAAEEVDPTTNAVFIGLSKSREALFRKVGQPALLAIELTARGRALMKTAGINEAIDAFRRSLAIRRQLSSLPGLASAEHDLALALFKRSSAGDLEEAAEQVLRTQVAALKAENPEGVARAFLLRGNISEKLGWIDDALFAYRQAHAAALSSGLEGLIANCEGELAFCLWTAIASRQVKDLLADLPLEEMLHRVSRLLVGATLDIKEGDRPQAEEAARLFASAFRVHERRQEWASLAKVGASLAECLEALGDGPRGLLAHCTAYLCARRAGDSDLAAMAIRRIRSSAQGVLPEVPLDGLDDSQVVAALQANLVDRGFLI